MTLFDLQLRGRIKKILVAGTNGTKFPGIRNHLKKGLSQYKNMAHLADEFLSFPSDNTERDPLAYQTALKQMNHGDIVIIFTPDHTHYTIICDCIKADMHVYCAKPLVQKLEHHLHVIELLKSSNRSLLSGIEVHKRWDPIYQDAYSRIASGKLGQFSLFHSYMSQPISQLETFSAWASETDISYYLNSHHVDFHCWALTSLEQSTGVRWRPVTVYACGSSGMANHEPYNLKTEDSITLTVQWETIGETRYQGTATYCSSWIAPKQSDVHSQQRFFYQGTKGECNIDQAHRGYTLGSEETGFRSVNPLFMKYTPSLQGHFAGHMGYGYRSIASFVEAVIAVESKQEEFEVVRSLIPSMNENISTLLCTAILDAGRKSLDNKSVIKIEYENDSPIKLNM
jgi:D-galacturonate reductase